MDKLLVQQLEVIVCTMKPWLLLIVEDVIIWKSKWVRFNILSQTPMGNVCSKKIGDKYGMHRISDDLEIGLTSDKNLLCQI